MSCSSPRAECAANFRNPLQQLKAAAPGRAGPLSPCAAATSQLPSAPASQGPEEASGDGGTTGIESRQLQTLKYSGYPRVAAGSAAPAGLCQFAWLILVSCSRSPCSSASFFLAFLGDPRLAELGCLRHSFQCARGAGQGQELFPHHEVFNLGPARPLELLSLRQSCHLLPSTIPMASSVICPRIPPGEGRSWVWVVVSSPDLSVLQLPAAPPAMARPCSPQRAHPGPGDPAAAQGCPQSHPQSPALPNRESLSWAGLSGHCPEPQPGFQSCSPELCWAPGDAGDSRQSKVCQDSAQNKTKSLTFGAWGDALHGRGVLGWPDTGGWLLQHLLAAPARLGSAVSKPLSSRKMTLCIN